MATIASCPEESTIWAFVHGDLGSVEARSVRVHLDACDGCREVVAVLARGTPSQGAQPTVQAVFPTEDKPASAFDSSEPPVSVGTIVAGKYKVEGPIGSGGMGYVVAARHVQLGTRVALKLLHPRIVGDAEARGRFLAEARAAARIESPHVVRVYDVDTIDEVPFFVMELLDGNDLAKELTARGKLPLGEAARYVLQAARALTEAHRAGIVHRDLKPANLFLVRTGETRSVKVLDFGISKKMGRGTFGDGDISTGVRVVGTPRYMAPEQLTFGREVDERADIWALGVVFAQLVSGKLPFEGVSVEEYCRNVVSAEPYRARDDTPPAVVEILIRCLAKDPVKRYGSIVELAAALEMLADETVRRSFMPPPPPRRSRRGRIAAVGVAIAAVLAAATIIIVRHGEPAPEGPPTITVAETATVPVVSPPPATAPPTTEPVTIPSAAVRGSIPAPRKRHPDFGGRR